MNMPNYQNLLYSSAFFVTSAISYLRGEIIPLICSIVMTLLLFIIYIAFKVMYRKDIATDNITSEKEAITDENIFIEQNWMSYENS
jgi:hypothetical protein